MCYFKGNFGCVNEFFINILFINVVLDELYLFL